MKTWLRNLKNLHHRLMMRYLQKRGWVVFYLEEEQRDWDTIKKLIGNLDALKN